MHTVTALGHDSIKRMTVASGGRASTILIVGGVASKGVAESIDSTGEDAYWRENYKKSLLKRCELRRLRSGMPTFVSSCCKHAWHDHSFDGISPTCRETGTTASQIQPSVGLREERLA